MNSFVASKPIPGTEDWRVSNQIHVEIGSWNLQRAAQIF